MGVAIYEVVSGSMEPTIPTGSMVFLDVDDRDFEVGDVVAYHVDIPEYDPVLHRIYAPGDELGTWKMKGDANDGIDFEGSDKSNIREDDIVGTVFLHVPLLGAILWFCSLFPWWVLMTLFVVIFISPDLFDKLFSIAFSATPPDSPANPQNTIGESGGRGGQFPSQTLIPPNRRRTYEAQP